jgi:hypothetical protein
MKINSINDLENHLTDDFTWRIREISNLSLTAQNLKSVERGAVLRSTIPMLYAHWEGYIKIASEKYLEFIASRRLSFDELHSGVFYLKANSLIKEISNANTKRKMKILVEILEQSKSKNKHNYQNTINTKSNLRHEILEDICFVIGIDTSIFSSEIDFINKRLCDRRNHIAHGQYIEITMDDFVKTKNETIRLIRIFRDEMMNSAIQEKFRKNI